jgi:DMSO/TMAO reductase YedYZ heme-binding membrane subunit
MSNLNQLADRAVGYVDFYAGVLSLVSLSLAVMGGVLALDRMVLRPRHRVQVQLLHRAVAALSVDFLLVHMALRLANGHVRPIDLGAPFLVPGRTLYVGLGTIAAQLMVVLALTGAFRSRFAHGNRPSVWRAVHATAYLCWPVALAHGLNAGRPPAPWVTASYQACVALVALALVVRLVAGRRQRAKARRAGRGATRELRIPRQATPSSELPAPAPAHVPANAPAGARPAPPRRSGRTITDEEFFSYLRGRG